MTHVANVIGGYLLTAGAVAAYVAWVVLRGRAVGRSLGLDNQADGSQNPDADAPHP